jgi:diacylglycerol kinase (ATP)
MNTFVIVNPRAGSGRTGRRWPDISKRLAGGIGRFDSAFTAGPGHATALARQAIEGGADLVIAVGGDGTISETVEGFAGSNGVPRDGCAFAAISAGTGADFARSLQTGDDPIAAIASGRQRRIDVGRVTYAGPDGKTARRLFVNIAGFGLSGTVDRAVNAERMSGFLPGWAAYYRATLSALLSHRAATVRLTIDDREMLTLDIHMVAVANGQYFGGGMRVAPLARLDSGEFEIIILRGGSKWTLVRDLGLVYRGAHMDHPMIIARRGRHVTAEAVDPHGAAIPLDIDGDSPGELGATFEILPAALVLWQ